MLTQLRRSHYFGGVAGIVTGTFSNCGDAAVIEPVLLERLADLGVPMIAWANVGHGGYFQTFPSASPPNSTPTPPPFGSSIPR